MDTMSRVHVEIVVMQQQPFNIALVQSCVLAMVIVWALQPMYVTAWMDGQVQIAPSACVHRVSVGSSCLKPTTSHISPRTQSVLGSVPAIEVPVNVLVVSHLRDLLVHVWLVLERAFLAMAMANAWICLDWLR